MKSIKSIFTALIIAASTIAVKGQTASVDNVVVAYIDVKNALVKGDGSLAADKAKALASQISAVKAAAKQQAAWAKYADKLATDARKISAVIKVDQQRASFAALSSNIYQLIKATGGNSETLYVQYCPMKKASWLSNKKEIENPYYGEQMLTCGGVKETLAANK